jgi:ATP-binding cassette, subfamily C, bacteriocin exporter
MKKSVKVRQRDITDCGAAALASIAAYHQLKMPVSRIRQFASTDKKGTNVLGLIEAATKLGFEAKGVRGEFDSLFKIPTPAIAHVIINDALHHYVVIYKAMPKFIQIMDPADGQIHNYKHDEFKKLWSGILVILWPSHDFKPGGVRDSLISRFWSLISPHKTIMMQALTGALVYTLLGLSTSIYVQKIVDYVLIDANKTLLNLMSVVMIAFLVLQVFIGVTKNIITLRTGQAIDRQLILGYYKHLMTLPQQFFDTMRVGEIVSRINDAVKIRAFVNDVCLAFTVNVFVLLLSIALMFTYYWRLALVILLVVPCYALILWITNRVNRKVERRLMENAAELESQLVESLNSINTIKSFGLEDHTNQKTETRFLTLLKTVYTSGLNSIWSGGSSDFLSRLFTILLLWIGSGFVLKTEITAGELLSFYALLGYFTGPANSLIGMNKAVQNAVIAADRLFEIMDLEREKNDRLIKITSSDFGDINFKNIHFRYGSRITVFEGLTLTIPKGKVCAIVGESGSGKSTLIAILQNIYLVSDGNILIGDYDLRHIETESLRRLIGVVPQKIDLFAGTVTENIAVGDYEPDMKLIIEICTELGILDFIENLPSGFATYLGENGATLSGGQKQRLAIARALYRDPEVLILDEATSSLDSISELYVQYVINLLRKKGKTVIIIAHRLSTVFKADKIAVLSGGLVVEEGVHDELIANRRNYFKLWQNQFPMAGTLADINGT